MPYYAVAVPSRNIRFVADNWRDVEPVKRDNPDRTVHFRKHDTREAAQRELASIYGDPEPVKPTTRGRRSVATKNKRSESLEITQDCYRRANGDMGVITTAKFHRDGGHSNKALDNVRTAFENGARLAAGTAARIKGSSPVKSKNKVSSTSRRNFIEEEEEGEFASYDDVLPAVVQRRVTGGRVTKRIAAPPVQRGFGASQRELGRIRDSLPEDEDDDDDDDDMPPSYDESERYGYGGRNEQYSGGGKILGDYDSGYF